MPYEHQDDESNHKLCSAYFLTNCEAGMRLVQWGRKLAQFNTRVARVRHGMPDPVVTHF